MKLDSDGAKTGRRRRPVRTKPAVLVVSPLLEDRVTLSQMLAGLGLNVHVARNVRESLNHLSSQQTAAVISEDVLPDGDWKNMLDGLARLSAKTNLVVTSRLADDALWAEVLNLGGYDVLAKPLDTDEVRRIVASACDHNRT
jgi:DNA-binding NtrC family response regulator